MSVEKLTVIDRKTTLSLIDFPGLIAVAEEAFIAQARGESSPPQYINLPVGDDNFAHFKAGFRKGSRHFVVKYSGGFWDNSAKGLPSDYGYVIVHNAETGKPDVMFYDQGAITDYRTAAAGAVCAKFLSRTDSRSVGIIGTGMQARLQLDALLYVRPDIREVRIWGRDPEKSNVYIHEMTPKYPALKFIGCDTPEKAVRDADILITVSASHTPIVKADWISPGTHITAVGACTPTMQEHEPEVLAKADKVYADSVEKCSADGEIHHALKEKALTTENITGELGAMILKQVPGRENDTEITFVDLVGLGIQDATAAEYLLGKITSDPADLPGYA